MPEAAAPPIAGTEGDKRSMGSLTEWRAAREGSKVFSSNASSLFLLRLIQKNHSKARMMARPATPPITPPTIAPVLVPLPDLPASVTAPVAIDDDVTRMEPFESVTVTTTTLVECSEADEASLELEVEFPEEEDDVLVAVFEVDAALVEGSIDEEELTDVDELGWTDVLEEGSTEDDVDDC